MYLYENKLEKELNFIVMVTQGYFPLFVNPRWACLRGAEEFKTMLTG